MFTGIFAGITWALETVILGMVFAMQPMIETEKALFLAPFVGTFLHDAFSALFMLVYNALRGNLKSLAHITKTPDFKWLLLSSAIGGPVGMTGYVLAVKYMGASIGAVASAIYPAIGTVLAYVFLKEKVKWYQWIFLVFTLLGVYGISYSPTVQIENVWLGLLGACMCAFGWGIEAVILAKCLRSPDIKNEYALAVRQTTSALVYGLVLLPVLGGWDFTCSLFVQYPVPLLPLVACAALCATVSYLFYYKTIAHLGAAKAMALNITYTAWAIVFTVLLGDHTVLAPATLACAVVVVVCGILAATDVKKLLERRQ